MRPIANKYTLQSGIGKAHEESIPDSNYVHLIIVPVSSAYMIKIGIITVTTGLVGE